MNVVTVDNTNYFSFLIDVNEPNDSGKSQISLDSLKIYTNPTPVAEITNIANIGSLGTLKFDLELAPDTFVTYNDVNQGSGRADIMLNIPTSAFAGVDYNEYFYMYQHWGAYYTSNGTNNPNDDINYQGQGGYEETAIGQGTPYNPGNITPVPEPGGIAGLMGLLAGGALLRSRRSAAA